ncbi:MAG: hypothetical protein FWD66_08935 [Paludibacter sp.]|nr:hypothetical protein [Paludibacter sp.]
MKVFKFILAVAIIATMASCGSGSSGKKLASNDILGDLPNLVYQKSINDSILEAEQTAEESKFKDVKKDLSKSEIEKLWAEAMKIDAKFKEREKAADEKFDAEIEKIKPQLIGKDIPYEVEDGCGYTVSSVKIKDVGNFANAEFEVSITDESAFKTRTWGYVQFCYQLLDKSGNLVDKEYSGEFSSTSISMSQKNGATGKGTISIFGRSRAPQIVNFAKIKFIKSK